MTTRVRAEALWEELGGDLCVCQHPAVPHWCERCQQRIDTIMVALARGDEVSLTRPEIAAARMAFVESIVAAVAELPDRTSPEDWPDAMLVTADELRRVVLDAILGLVP